MTPDAVRAACDSAKHLAAAEASIPAGERSMSFEFISHDSETAACMYWLMAFRLCPDTSVQDILAGI